MKFKVITTFVLSVLLFSCQEKGASDKREITFQNKGHELVFKMVEKVGDYATLLQKKDVVYTYTYTTPDGKADQSTEKYLFDGELSYGVYHQHERTFADLEGDVEQGYDGESYWLKLNGEILDDSTRLKRVAFSRPTNFYWFAMMQKLLDPGLKYEHLGEEKIGDADYDIVKVSFESKDDKPSDIYQLFINKKTALVDQFLFTVADFGVIETPFLMRLEYEEIDGLLIPTKRLYKKSTWNADVSEDPWIKVNWTDIKFDNKLTKENFKR